VRPFEYASAASLAEAAALLGEKQGRSRILAVGTDLITQMQEGIEQPERVVNLKGIAGLDRIEIGPEGMRLGPLVSLSTIAAHPGIAAGWRALAEAAGAAASPQIRNAGTLGGNLCQRPRCWYFRNAEFQCRKKGGQECFALEGENKYHAIFGSDDCRIVHPSDTAPALLAFEATVTLLSPRGVRELPLEGFFSMPSADVTRENVLEPDEILSEIRVPAPSQGTSSLYSKVREKASFDFALVSCAAVLSFNGATCTRARLVLGGVAPIPWRCRSAESLLEGRLVDDPLVSRAADEALRGAAPLSHNRYKVSLARNLLRRSLSALASPST